MKLKITHKLATILFVCIASVSVAQTTKVDSTGSTVDTSNSPSVYYVAVNDTIQIYNPLASPTAITWTSSDTKIATVLQNGKVLGIAPGMVTIYITNVANTIAMKWPIQVYKSIVDSTPIDTGVVIDPQPPIYPYTYYDTVGKTINIQPIVTIAVPYSWYSSDNTIATVDQKGNVTGITAGDVVIYISISDSSMLSKFLIHVLDTIYTKDTGIVITPEPPIYPNNYSLILGETINLTPDVAINTSYSWQTTDKSIAMVDANGNVTGLGIGNATIYLSLSNGTIVSKYEITVIDSSYNDSTKLGPNVNTLKLALGEKYLFTSKDSSVFVSTDSTIIAKVSYGFVATKVGETLIHEYDKSGNLLNNWDIFVYDQTPIDSTINVVPENPGYQTIYLSVGDTADIFNYVLFPSTSSIDWVTNGVINPITNGIFAAIAEGYTKCVVSTNDSLKKQAYVVIYVSSNVSIGKDSMIRILAMPVISPVNFQYQNYSTIEKLDSNSLRIVFDKEITDVVEIEKYLNLTYLSDTLKLKANSGSLTITSVSIDPTNNKALIITTKEVIPSTASLSVVYNNVAILSTTGTSYNKISLSNSQLTVIKSAKLASCIVYPTVASNTISITAESVSSIEIYSTNGQLIDRYTSNNSSQIIDVSNFRSGTYIVRLKTSKAQTVTKLFIKL